MKKVLGILALLMVFQISRGQKNPWEFVNSMPTVTGNICNHQAKEQFLRKVDDLKTELEEEILRRKNEAKRNQEGVDEAAAKNMMGQMGFDVSNADIQKMKNASKEQKKAMADEMMQKYMNMSVTEAKDVSKMSKQGKQAYAEAYTTEKMAEAQANPKQNEAVQKHSMGMAEMAQEQTELAQKIQAKVGSHEEKLAEYKKLMEKELPLYKKCCDAIDKKYASMANQSLGDDHILAINREKEFCYQNYCGLMMNSYSKLMNERRLDIIAQVDDYNRLDELSNQLTSATTGSKKGTYETGLTLLQAVKDYLIRAQDLP